MNSFFLLLSYICCS